jgi:hypothetical protein
VVVRRDRVRRSDGRPMGGQRAQKRRCAAGDCSARLLRQVRSQEAGITLLTLRAFTLFAAPAQQHSSTSCRRLAALLLAVRAPSTPHYSACSPLSVFRRRGPPFDPPATVSRLVPSSPRPLSTSHLQHSACTAPIHTPPRPLPAVAPSAHAIASALRASVAAARLPPVCPSPRSVSGLLRSLHRPLDCPPRRSARLATLPPTSSRRSVAWPI